MPIDVLNLDIEDAEVDSTVSSETMCNTYLSCT